MISTESGEESVDGVHFRNPISLFAGECDIRNKTRDTRNLYRGNRGKARVKAISKS